MKKIAAGNLSTGASERVHPTLHPALRILHIVITEPLFQIDSVDRLLWPHDIALVAERYGGIDAHPAFAHGLRRGPFALSRGHAFGRHERLAAAAGKRIDNVSLGIDASGEVPNDIVHIIGIGVFAHRDDHTGTL